MKPKIMGILNMTPDSFFDGARLPDTGMALERALQLLHEGADIIDVGGESTRPGASPVSAAEEARRILPVIEAISKKTKAPISVDTTKAAVARQAIEAGASMINDVSGASADTGMIAVLRDFPGVKIVVMHSRGTPQDMHMKTGYQDLVLDVKHELKGRIDNLLGHGVGAERIIADPGFGFAKDAGQNQELLLKFAAFRDLGFPLLAGVSRKRFLGEMGGGIPQAADRLPATLAAHFWLLMNHVDILRVHDVKETLQVINFKQNLFNEGVRQ